MLTYYPKRGSILFCDYTTGFKEPEMVKRRPVVVISHRFRSNYRLCTVVPLSTTDPLPKEPFHLKISLEQTIPYFEKKEVWIKTNMINTVSFERLDKIKTKRLFEGKRKYLDISLTSEQLKQLEKCLKVYFSLK